MKLKHPSAAARGNPLVLAGTITVLFSLRQTLVPNLSPGFARTGHNPI